MCVLGCVSLAERHLYPCYAEGYGSTACSYCSFYVLAAIDGAAERTKVHVRMEDVPSTGRYRPALVAVPHDN